MMQGHKRVQRQRTYFGISASVEGCKHLSADSESRLLLLHRKCPNPAACVRSIPTSSPPAVPDSVPFIGGISPIVCQPISFKPRPRQVASLSETLQMQVAGNGILSSSTESSPPHPTAKQHRLRRKVYTGKSHSADVGSRCNPENPTDSKDILQDKGRNTDVYIPTAFGSLHPKPMSGNRKLKDCDRNEIQQNIYCVDVVQHEGALRMVHVEHPRPLPPRDDVPVYGDNHDISASTSSRLHSRPVSAVSGQCVTGSELCPSRPSACDQFQNVCHLHSRERPLRTSLSTTNSSQPMCSDDTEQTFCRVSVAQKQNPTTVGSNRTARGDHSTLCRSSSMHQVLQTADRQRRRLLSVKKSVADDVGEAGLCSDGEFNRRSFGNNPRALFHDDGSDPNDSVSIHNKYFDVVISQLILLSQ